MPLLTPTPILADAGPRRRLLRAALALAAGAAAGSAGLLQAQDATRGAGLRPTPPLALGPFYPDRMPTETDADLTRMASRAARAEGQLVVLAGRLVDTRGRPLAGAQLELWQANTHGRYTHSADNDGSGPLDPNFQGYGRLSTDAQGRYSLTTILPGPYGARTPHLHFIASHGTTRLTTQMFFEGEKANERDGLFRALGIEARRAVTARKTDLPAGSPPGAQALAWEIVLPA